MSTASNGADAFVGTSYSSTLFGGAARAVPTAMFNWRTMIVIIAQARKRVAVAISDSPHQLGFDSGR